MIHVRWCAEDEARTYARASNERQTTQKNKRKVEIRCEICDVLKSLAKIMNCRTQPVRVVSTNEKVTAETQRELSTEIECECERKSRRSFPLEIQVLTPCQRSSAATEATKSAETRKSIEAKHCSKYLISVCLSSSCSLACVFAFARRTNMKNDAISSFRRNEQRRKFSSCSSLPWQTRCSTQMTII